MEYNDSTAILEGIVWSSTRGKLNTDWLDSIEGEMQTTTCKIRKPYSSMSGANKVPKWLASEKVMAKYPLLVSIGPYHRGKDSCKEMQDYKWLFVESFMALNSEIDLEKCLMDLVHLENRARRFYLEYIDMSSGDFVKMMLLDGCTIIMLLLVSWNEYSGSVTNIVSSSASNYIDSKMMELLEDLILMENQIPFFILEHLFERIRHKIFQQDKPTLVQLALLFLYQFVSKYLVTYIGKIQYEKNKKIERMLQTNFESMLHLYYLSFFELPWKEVINQSNKLCCNKLCFFRSRPPQEKKSKYVIHSATRLEKNGVLFKEKTTKLARMSDSIWRFEEITFSYGTLKIPRIVIDDPKMMNLVAFEQYWFRNLAEDNNGSTDYTPLSHMMYFLASLIRTPKDLEILEECGIIDRANSRTDDTVNFFGQLRSNLQLDLRHSHLRWICHRLNNFTNSYWSWSLANLWKEKLDTPWKTISLIVAIFILVVLILRNFFQFHKVKI